MNRQAAGDGTVGKALEVLDQVAGKSRPVRFAELLSESTHPKATLYRLLQTLVRQGMLAYDDDLQTYKPGLRLVRLAHAAWRQSSLAPIARPFLDHLADIVGETIHLAQLDQGQVLYVDKRNPTSPIEMFSQAGKVSPGYCTGVGKAMIAFLDQSNLDEVIAKQSFYQYTEHTLTSGHALREELAEVRAEGIAYDREEHEPGIICIAAPILNTSGRMLGALSITTSSQRKSIEDLEQFRHPLLEAAGNIAAAAQSWQFPE